MKRRSLILTLVFTLVLLTTPALASQEDEQWQPLIGFKYNPPVDDAPKGFLLEEAAINATSFLFGEKGTWNQDFERYICTSTQSKDCIDADTFAYNAILPTCETVSDVDCVVTISAVDASGVSSPGKFETYASPNHPNDFEADKTLGIPRGTSGGIWSIPGSPHSGGSLYAVYVTVAGAVKTQEGASSTYGLNLSAQVVPVSVAKTMKREKYWGCHQDNSLRPDTKANTACGPFRDKVIEIKCIGPYGTNNDECLTPRAFPTGTSFKLDVRFSRQPLGWLHGRLMDPSVAITRSASSYLVSVEAKPVKVPAISHEAKYSELPVAVRDFWDNLETRCVARNGCGKRSSNNYSLPLKSQSSIFTSLSFGDQALEALKVYLPLVDDKAAAIPGVWSWRTLGQWELENSNKCLLDGEGVKGIVTTNASVYSAGPPSFADGELRYRVAAPHNAPDGSVFKGDYSLSIDSKVARCLYNYSSAPISATVSVIGTDGAKSVATTTVSERDGWLNLVARNFEFSSPVIVVKVTQEKSETKSEVTGTSTPSATSTAKPAKNVAGQKITIVCKKGKVEKEISSRNPKCPNGFKRKS